jgi:8-oxo-dGTP pyrophosphatase MutT (NUDIX family)
MRVIGTFIECNNDILLLKRLPNTRYPNSWCLPAGKTEPYERAVDTAIREIKEETGFKAEENEMLFCLRKRFNYHERIVDLTIFRLKISALFQVKLSPKEHQEFRWVSPKNSLEMNLINGLDEIIKQIYTHKILNI